MEGLVLHEDHVSDFEAMHEVLDGRAQVTSASPDVFNVGDLIGVDLEGLSEPAVVELQTLVLKELVVARHVENLDPHHDEPRVMAAGDADVIQVVESRAELRADQGVGWGVELASDAVGLEAEDASSHEVNVISPAGYNGVAIDCGAGDTCGSQTLLKSFPGFSEGDLFALSNAVADKGVGAAAAREGVRCNGLTWSLRRYQPSRYGASSSCRT